MSKFNNLSNTLFLLGLAIVTVVAIGCSTAEKTMTITLQASSIDGGTNAVPAGMLVVPSSLPKVTLPVEMKIESSNSPAAAKLPLKVELDAQGSRPVTVPVNLSLETTRTGAPIAIPIEVSVASPPPKPVSIAVEFSLSATNARPEGALPAQGAVAPYSPGTAVVVINGSSNTTFMASGNSRDLTNSSPQLKQSEPPAKRDTKHSLDDWQPWVQLGSLGLLLILPALFAGVLMLIGLRRVSDFVLAKIPSFGDFLNDWIPKPGEALPKFEEATKNLEKQQRQLFFARLWEQYCADRARKQQMRFAVLATAISVGWLLLTIFLIGMLRLALDLDLAQSTHVVLLGVVVVCAAAVLIILALIAFRKHHQE